MTMAASSGTPLGVVVRNVAINAVSCGALFGVGLLLVPILVGHYGLVQYGLIMASRLFLLEGLMRVFDLGLPDVAARSVARARGGDRGRARAEVASCLWLSLGQGLLTAAVLAALAGPLATMLAPVEGGRYVPVMHDVLLWTAAALVLQYPGQVFDGVLRGQERFDLVRLAEIGFLVSAGAAVVLAVAQDQPFQVAAYIWIVLSTVRYMALGLLVACQDRRRGGGLSWPGRQDYRVVLRLSKGLWLTRIHTTAANFLPQLLIAKFLGPASLGLFDILARPTRYLRMALNLMASALFPAAARLDGGRDADHLRQVVVVSGALLAAVFLPAIAAFMALGDRLLAVWIDPAYAPYGPWLAVFLGWIATMVLSQPGILALSSRPEALRRINRLGFLQLGLMLGIGVGLMGRLGEFAFIAGGTMGAAVVLPFQMNLVRRGIGAGWWEILRYPVRFLAAGLLPLAALASLPDAPVHDPLFLAAALSGWLVLHGLSILAFGLGARERALLIGMVPMLRKRPAV